MALTWVGVAGFEPAASSSTAVQAALLHDFGEHWQIQRVDGSTMWTAIERPVVCPARFYVAESAEQRADLLANDRELRLR